jgi:pyruvate formate lyase activating enzyme
MSRRGFVTGFAASCAGCAFAGARSLEAEPLQDPFRAQAPAGAEEGGLNPVPARWSRPLENEWVECGVCPRACRISPGERGTCGTRENRGGRLYTLVHSRPCALGLDPVEKKPFFHVLPGATALSLATPGCNLECRCCQNWEIAQARPEQVRTFDLPPAGVVALARQKGAPLVACTYTEPVVFSEYVLDIARAAKRAGVRTLMISNGYVQEQPLADLCRELTAYKVDLKGFDEAFFRRHTGGELKHVLETLRRLRKHGTWTEIVSLVIPGQNDSEAEARALCRFVRDEVGPETPVHFTRFHPSYRLQNVPSTPVATLERSRAIALAEGLKFVYLGNVPGHPGESTYCPGCARLLIRRVGMSVAENRMRGGACPACARAIPGVWS